MVPVGKRESVVDRLDLYSVICSAARKSYVPPSRANPLDKPRSFTSEAVERRQIIVSEAVQSVSNSQILASQKFLQVNGAVSVESLICTGKNYPFTNTRG